MHHVVRLLLRLADIAPRGLVSRAATLTHATVDTPQPGIVSHVTMGAGPLAMLTNYSVRCCPQQT